MNETRQHIVDVAEQPTAIAEAGVGDPVLLIHGSGPGVSALANWAGTLPALASAGFRAIAPDMIGFGGTIPPDDHEYALSSWVAHAVGVLDRLGVARADIVGNSFGGAVAIQLAAEHPERVRRLVLMGSVGVPFELTEALDAGWGYEPSVDAMSRILNLFAYDRGLISEGLAKQRYESSIQNGAAERFARMFPAPRQRWIDAMAATEEQLKRIEAQTLLIHGRDDRVIPLQTSLTLLDRLAHVELHVFGECGHWTQIERRDEFNALLTSFFRRDNPTEAKEPHHH
ncbi:alpha/beta fold hydrolase [Microbacterium lacus]|uniref:alpha/beta fold hydrolase n=1 Tax=Microbacterium lacus TaxID=415217 RepID=UPI000C2C190A|nr:alpha/beta hydrolase [Microbacterium lacus]